jgi:hypothetical protein
MRKILVSRPSGRLPVEGGPVTVMRAKGIGKLISEIETKLPDSLVGEDCKHSPSADISGTDFQVKSVPAIRRQPSFVDFLC